ncbi:MAG: hypothetical protein A2039_02270 [Candidatus Melainabacteria bacterium GWA2_34_9]|nr:MAG: hypothetical protein A2039_02270 [Candidatus Melainabacteria bacterium GWA2_34_9]
MKNSVSIKILLGIFSLFAGILFSSVAFAAPSQIVLFCSSWNMKCREAKLVCSAAAQELGISYSDLDVDQANSQQKANAMGLNLPSAIPYIYILDNKGKVVKGKLYKGETSQSLQQELMKY